MLRQRVQPSMLGQEEALWERLEAIEQQLLQRNHNDDALRHFCGDLDVLLEGIENWAIGDQQCLLRSQALLICVLRLRIMIEERWNNREALPPMNRHPVLRSPKGRSYKLDRRLRNTLYGDTFLAQELDRNVLVVIKVSYLRPLPHLAHEDPKREVELLDMLRGIPGVIQLLDKWQEDDLLFAVLEYANRGELFDIIANAPQAPTLAEVRHWGLAIARALNSMHEQVISHLDVSLENIFMFDDGDHMQAKLGDLGMAMHMARHHLLFPPRAGTGKRGYMAPEILRDHWYSGPKVDIFALGVCLFTMITRQPLFSDAHGALEPPELRYVESGRLDGILHHRRIMHLMTPNAVDLIGRMLLPEDQRIGMEDVLRHPFWKEQ